MKTLSKKEMIEWIESAKLPIKLSVIQLTPNMLIMRRITKENQCTRETNAGEQTK